MPLRTKELSRRLMVFLNQLLYIITKVEWARSFQQLVRQVYLQFPEYRENSVFQQ